MNMFSHKLKLFLRQRLDTISDYDLVDDHTNSWAELDILSEVQRAILLRDLESKALTSESKSLIQRLFVSGITVHHLRMVKISGAFSLISLLLFIFVDAVFVPDVLWISIVFKIFLVTPISLYGIVQADRRSALVEILAMLGYVLTEVMLVCFMLFSTAPLAWVYGFAIAVVSMNANLIQSVPTKNAALLTLLSIAFAVVGFCFNAAITIPVMIFSLACTVLFCAFSLVANYRLEVVYRRQYMSGLEEKLRVDQLVDRNRELNQHALLDSVTGIGNRRFLDEKISWYYTAFSLSKQPLGLLMIDVDYFKRLNDKHGHLVGDACLRRVAEVLASGTRSSTDLVARYGGEEFVIVLPGATKIECWDMADQLRSRIERTAITVEGASEPILLTVSIGCHSAVPDVDGQATDFIAKADAAVYAAKRGGRNRVYLSGFDDLLQTAQAS